MEATYLLVMWCPVYKGRESNLGSDTKAPSKVVGTVELKRSDNSLGMDSRE